MSDDAYHEVLVRIIETQAKDDGNGHGADHIAAMFARLVDLYAEAADLAPPEFTDAWTTLAGFHRRFAATLGSDEAPRPTREEIDGATDAMKTLQAHVQEDYGLDLVASPSPAMGPPPPIPDEPALDVPDGPVDEAEYERLVANRPEIGVERDPEHDMARLSEHFSAAAAIAPWNVRPALAVTAAQMQDTLDHLRDPSLGDQPGRVTPEQVAAAGAILRWDNRTSNAT